MKPQFHIMVAKNISSCTRHNLPLPERFIFIKVVFMSSNTNMAAEQILEVIYKSIYI
jgi:hypothetical protein